MLWGLLIIAVSNGRFYHEVPMHVITYKTRGACETKARTYPTSGTSYKKAVCVPVLQDGSE